MHLQLKHLLVFPLFSVQRVSETCQRADQNVKTVSLTEGRNKRSKDKNSGEETENETLSSSNMSKFTINRIVLASKIAFPVIFFVFNIFYHVVYV